MRLRAWTLIAAVLAPAEAHAIRWTLGVGSELTPIVIDPERPDGSGIPFRLGFRPILELEPIRWIAIGAYAPFVVYRAGEGGSGAASSGAESVFGLSVAVRYPWLRAEPPEEVLFYLEPRGGFATVSGRPGPFAGGAIGAAITWLDTGRGLFFEINASHVAVSDAPVGVELRDVRRTTVSFGLGVVFRLGGEDWQVGGRTPL
jgi:hypothetical protein